MKAAAGRREARIRSLTSPERGRPPVELGAALDLVRRELGVDFARATARAGFSRGHLIDIVLKLPGGTASDAERHAARRLLTLVLGEARAEDWLGEVRIEPAARGGLLRVLDANAPSVSFFALDELVPTFERAIAGLRAGLPERPLWALGGEQLWTMLEASAERADDYAAQDDLVLATTYQPEMLKCFLGGASFASARFSRHREIFAYLKTEARTRDPRLALAARRVLEDALDAALVTERCGRVVGSGVGIRYFYVDVALAEIDRSLALLAEVAARVGLPERSWVLYCDTALADEWEALHPSAPAPP